MFYAIFCVTNRVFAAALMRFLIILFQRLNLFSVNGRKTFGCRLLPVSAPSKRSKVNQDSG
jgi:hypothetical protein